MELDIREMAEEAFAEWVEALSIRELLTNEPLLRAIEQFECILFATVKGR